MNKTIRIISTLIMLVVLTTASIFLSTNIHSLLTVKRPCISVDNALALMKEEKVLMLFGIFEFFSISLVAYMIAMQSNLKYKSNMQWVTPDIQTPMPEGQNQYGSARWLKKERYDKAFSTVVIKVKSHIFSKIVAKSCYILDKLPYFKKHSYGAKFLNKASNLSSKYKGIVLRICNKLDELPIVQKYSLGTAFLNKKEAESKLYSLIKRGRDDLNGNETGEVVDINTISSAGVVVGSNQGGSKLYYIANDTHMLCIGATRSGKTRFLVLLSACLQALAGENMIFADPKGELFCYLMPFLKRLGYEVVALDFVNPQKSDQYNFLQPIIDLVNQGDIPRAQDATWDIVSCLVGDSKGEPIWHNGECAILACAILAVIYDNKEKPQYQNFTNVYHFIGKMCKPNKKGLPLERYLREKPDNHPAKALVDISDVAPERTKGSFFTCAVATLRLFTNQYIYDMTCNTSFDMYDGNQKRAIFIMLPDEKSTYYSVASLFCSQYYQVLTGIAKKMGNRLPRRTNYNLDEFGNFAFIPDFSKMLTVGGGRGMRFNLFLQDFSQLNEKYGDNVAKTIRGNCETWVYLQTSDHETRREISDKLGNYTIKSPSLSSSSSYGSNTNNSASYNYTSRNLLEPNEVGRIKRPYQLVMSQDNPAVMYSCGIGKSFFNKVLGLGNEKHNIEVMIKRDAMRPSRNSSTDMQLWKIWEKYKATDDENMESVAVKPTTIKATAKIITKNQQSIADM